MVLSWITSWVTDIVKYAQSGDVDQVQNPDLKKSLQALAERLELKPLYQFYDALLLARSQLVTQVNKQLLLEQLLIDWSQLNTR